jgi:hypothetical protein
MCASGCGHHGQRCRVTESPGHWIFRAAAAVAVLLGQLCIWSGFLTAYNARGSTAGSMLGLPLPAGHQCKHCVHCHPTDAPCGSTTSPECCSHKHALMLILVAVPSFVSAVSCPAGQHLHGADQAAAAVRPRPHGRISCCCRAGLPVQPGCSSTGAGLLQATAGGRQRHKYPGRYVHCEARP